MEKLIGTIKGLLVDGLGVTRETTYQIFHDNDDDELIIRGDGYKYVNLSRKMLAECMPIFHEFIQKVRKNE